MPRLAQEVVFTYNLNGSIIEFEGKIVLDLNLESYEKLVKRMLAEKEDDSRIGARIVAERIKRWSRQIKR